MQGEYTLVPMAFGRLTNNGRQPLEASVRGTMIKFIPLTLLAGLVAATVLAAPKPTKEGLVTHEAAG